MQLNYTVVSKLQICKVALDVPLNLFQSLIQTFPETVHFLLCGFRNEHVSNFGLVFVD